MNSEMKRRDNERKAERINILMSAGMPRESATICDEMTCHAAEESIDAMMRVVNSCTPQLRMIVTQMAIKMITVNLEEVKRIMSIAPRGPMTQKDFDAFLEQEFERRDLES